MNRFPSTAHALRRLSQAARRGRGFTLVELMVTIAIAGILSTLAAPALVKMFKTNRVQTEAGGFVSDLMLARTEAVKRGQNVSMCVTADGATCTATPGTAWQGGWIVFSDPAAGCTGPTSPAVPIRIRSAFRGTDTLVASLAAMDCVTFNREGFTNNLGTSTVTFTLHTADNLGTATRCVAVDLGGRVSTLTVGQTSSSGQGTCS